MGRRKLLLFCCFLMIWLLGGHTAEAKSLGDGEKVISKGNTITTAVELDQSGVLAIEAEVRIWTAAAKSSNDALRVKLKNASGQVISNELCRLSDGWVGNVWTIVFDSGKVLPAGRYTYVLENAGSHVLRVGYDIKSYPSFADSITIPTSISMKTGDDKVLPIQTTPADSFAVIKDVQYSDDQAVYLYYEKGVYKVLAQKAGKYTLTIILENEKSYTCTITITDPAPAIGYRELTLYKGESVKNKVYFTTKKAKWTSNNKNVAVVDKNGKIKAKNFGKCTITGKVGSKVYKCKVKVIERLPNFRAKLQKDNSKGSSFKVKISNYSNKPLTVLSKNAFAYHNKLSKYDRYITLKNDQDVKIAPGKTKTVKFNVLGGKTTKNAKAHTLYYYFKFDGKKYQGTMTIKGSGYKRKKQWYNTYWEGY